MSQYLIPEQLDRKSSTPLYSQIYEQLKRELVLGKYKTGERFYSYRKLKEVYKTELRTIAAAVDLLIEDGLVENGSGAVFMLPVWKKFLKWEISGMQCWRNSSITRSSTIF